jgi:hypothetical protein
VYRCLQACNQGRLEASTFAGFVAEALCNSQSWWNVERGILVGRHWRRRFFSLVAMWYPACSTCVLLLAVATDIILPPLELWRKPSRSTNVQAQDYRRICTSRRESNCRCSHCRKLLCQVYRLGVKYMSPRLANVSYCVEMRRTACSPKLCYKPGRV